MNHAEEIELEPIPGLPGLPPQGERVLWQGRPGWKSLTRYAFRVRWLAAYFGVVVVVSATMGASFTRLATMSLVFAAGLGLCALMAWLQARSTVYTITSHRVVMRIGVALPVTWNFPFARLESADSYDHSDGTGDIALRLVAPDRVAWFHLWPHARPGRRLRARPTLRAVADPSKVAARLEQAVRTWAADTKTSVTFDAESATPVRDPALPVRPTLASTGT